MTVTPRSPRLSIVIPTLNRAELVRRALDSALAQTCRDIEILVSNNGSTDHTRQVLEGYSDPRLRVFQREDTIPACAHGNFLVDAARGEFLLGLSDDDYLEPDFAERVMALFDRHPGLAFVYACCWRHYGDVRVPTPTGPEIEPGTDFIAGFLAGERDVCWCSCVTRTSDLREIGPIPEGTLFGDLFYWGKLAFRGAVGCVTDPVSHYTFMGDNLSSGVPVSLWSAESRKVVEEMLASWQAARPRDAGALRRVEHSAARFLARTTANQFVWCALRGSTRGELWRELRKVWRHLEGAPSVWPRVAAALLLPRKLLKRTVLQAARRQGHEYEARLRSR